MKKVLAPRSEVTALDRVEASIERVFRDSHGRFESGSANTITVELVAGLHPPSVKTKVATTFDIKGCWKEHQVVVCSIAREAAEVWATAEQADKLRRVQSRPEGAVAQVISDKEEKKQ